MLKTLLKIGFAMDALRLWPRFFVCTYLIGLVRLLGWYLDGPHADWSNAAVMTAYAAFCIPILKWYMDSGVDWTPFMALWFEHFNGKEIEPEHRKEEPCGTSPSTPLQDTDSITSSSGFSDRRL